MAKRKRPKTAASDTKGYDHGTETRSMLVSSFDFVRQLSVAQVRAVGYGDAPFAGKIIPNITLIGRDSAALKSAFNQFDKWCDKSDGDAVEFSIVFQKSGGYILGISPETERLKERTAGFDKVHTHLFSLVTWVLPLPTVHPSLRMFQEYKRSLVSPFYLDAGIYYGGHTNEFADIADVRPLRDVRPILKFRATLVEEEEVIPHSIPGILLSTTAAQKNKKGKSIDRPSPRERLTSWHARRTEMLTCHFPVTLERIASSAKLKQFMEILSAEGIREWQFNQSICNLLLSEETLGGEFHFKNISSKELEESIQKHLMQRCEHANGKNIIEKYSLDTIRKQIFLDSSYLLSKLGIRCPVNTIHEALQYLEKEKELDPKDSNYGCI